MATNRFTRIIQETWQAHSWVGALVFFSAAAALFTLWTAAPTFSDPDSFYHIKMTEIMMHTRAAVTDFPWLPFTSLNEAFVDHHLLYHIVLIPFFLLFGSVLGMKVATVVLAAAGITCFYVVLRALRIPLPAAWTLLLLTTHSFTFRIGLAKAPSVSFLFLTLGFFLLVRRKWGLLTLLSFFYVWAYGGFLLLPIIACVFALVETGTTLQRNGWPGLKEVARLFMPAWAAVTGMVAGLLVHPSFPQHFKFYWEQVVQIGLVNYGTKIGVGAEWYPLIPTDLLLGPILVTAVFVPCIIIFFATVRKQTTPSKTALLMAVIFSIFSMKSQRYVEYYIPWAILFSAFSLHASGAVIRVQTMLRQKRLAERVPAHLFEQAAYGLLIVYFCVIVPGIMVHQARQTYDSLHGGIRIDRFQAAMPWLRAHSTRGDIVFHNDWDDFPILFYYSGRNRYIAGLDPTFFYTQEPELYWKWEAITTGKQTDQLLEMIQKDFRARFVFIDSDHAAMRNNIIRDGRFKKVYEDTEATIFRVPRP